MTASSQTATTSTWTGREMLNKVPEVTLYFWVIKIMCTTVGETAADYLNVNPGFGLTNTTYFTGALLAVILLVQFRLRRYVPGVYWSAVVVISVFGTLITDNLTDNYNVPLTTTTPICAAILAIVFAVWYWFERTLSIHTIVTRFHAGGDDYLTKPFARALGRNDHLQALVAERGDLGGVPVAAAGQDRVGLLVEAGLIELAQRGVDHRFELAGVVGLLGDVGGQDDLADGCDRLGVVALNRRFARPDDLA
jgi:uncharacterized membrane-anchored protein